MVLTGLFSHSIWFLIVGGLEQSSDRHFYLSRGIKLRKDRRVSSIMAIFLVGK